MQFMITTALVCTGLLSLISLLWFTYKYIDTYLGLKVRRINTRQILLANQSMGYTPLNIDAQDFQTVLIENLHNTKLYSNLHDQILKSGLVLKADVFLGLSLLAGIFLSLLSYALVGNIQIVLVSAFLGFIFPYLILKYLVRRRQSLLESQLPDLLEFMARSLQVGHSLNNSLQMVSNESPMPISGEFKKVFEELNYGLPIEKVLSGLADRIECAEVRFFVIAVVVNREIGGDLAEILRKVSKLIRERMELRQTIRVLTSEGRASGMVLGVLPFVIGALIFYINPESYTLMIHDPLGRKLFMYAGVLMLIGYFWINRMCVIEE